MVKTKKTTKMKTVKKKKVSKKKSSVKKVRLKKLKPAKSSRLKIKRDVKSDEKILLGVSQPLSDLTGIPVNIIRALFFVSSILLIGLPIYLLLSFFFND